MNTIQKPVQDIVQDNMMNYSAYVLLDRALSDVRDGLKPGQRRILITMLNEKAFTFTKSANVSGAVMKLHPHGDSYPTIVHMVQKDNQNIPLIIGKGNFAQHTSRDMQPGANRYTEIKLAEVSKDMLKNIKKGMVNIIPNYDGTLTMPEVLPVKFPLVLTQVAIGIGVGFSSSIPSYNLIELVDAMIEYINNGTKTLLYPDFATGGYISSDVAAANQISETGLGPVKIRGKAKIVGNEIQITEIPYSTTREAIIEKVIELAKTEKLKEVVDIKDLTDLHGQMIEIRCRRNTDMQSVLDKLYKLTPLQTNFNANMNMLIDDLPRVAGVWDTVSEWLLWRKECIIKGLMFDTDKMKDQLHLLKGLEKVLLDIDSAIEIIRATPEKEMIPALMAKYSIDETQATEVADMKLKYINRDYILKKVAEIDELAKRISINERAIKSDAILNQIIIKGLKESAEQYGQERKTEIVEMSEIGKLTFVKQNTPDYPMYVKLTKDGYAYKAKTEKELTLKAGDAVIQSFETVNSAELLVFTVNGDCHKIKLSDIDETKPNQFGTYLPAVMGDNDEIIGYSVFDNKHKFIVSVFENRKVAKIDLQSFVGNRKKLKNSLNMNSKLMKILTFANEDKFTVVTNRYTVECNTSDFTLTAKRDAQGAFATTRKGEVVKVY